MEGFTVAGNSWVSWNTSIVLHAYSFWSEMGNYTQWHLEKASVFRNLTAHRPVEELDSSSATKWGYMWSEHTKISDPLSCYTGEKCKIKCVWDSIGYRCKHKKDPHSEQRSFELRQTSVQIRRIHNSVSFVFGFYGPAEYHLEFQQEYWASPVARKWYFFEKQQYLKYPIYMHGVPVGLIHYKKGHKFEDDY